MPRHSQVIERTAEGFVLRTRFQADMIDEIKAVPGRRYNPEDRSWTIPLQAADVAQALAQKYHLSLIDPQAPPSTNLRQAKAQMQAVLADIKAIRLPQPIPGFTGKLLPWQKEAIQYGLFAPRVLIADDMGLGKTVEALAIIACRQLLRPLLVVPATAKETWAEMIAEFFPGWGIRLLSGTSKKPELIKRGNPHGDTIATLINYDILHHWVPHIHRADAIVFDESHRIKSPTARRTKAAITLVRQLQPQTTLLLSGTPIVNYPADLISQLDALATLPALGGMREFINRYCGPYRDRFGYHIDGATNLDELGIKLRSTCMIRRLRDEVMPDRQAPQVVRVSMSLPLRHQRKYTELEVELKQAYAAVQALAETQDVVNDNKVKAAMSHLRTALAEMKGDFAVEWCKEFLETADNRAMGGIDGKQHVARKLVIYAEHHALVDQLKSSLHALCITGRESATARNLARHAFQENPQHRVIIISAAGNENITLTAASDMLVAELPLTPKDLTQAIARIDRQGQTARVEVFQLVAQGTLDEPLESMLAGKLTIASALDNGNQTRNGGSLTAALLKMLYQR